MSQPIRVLYVDDNPLDRELVRDALEKEHGGFLVTEARSRMDFEEQVTKGAYDVVLSDFNILGFEGLQVLDSVQVTKPHLPVVIVTGTGSEEVAVEAMKRGASDYVIKSAKHILRLPLTIHAALEKKRLEEEREQTEQERNRLFNYSIDLLCIAGFDGYFKQLNPAWKKTLGWTNKKLMDKPYLEFVHPDDREPTAHAAARLVDGKSVLTFENRYCCKDGSYRWISWNSYPLKEENLIFAVARDITVHKQVEETLAHERNLLRTLIDNLPDSIYVKDTESRFVIGNLGVVYLMGATTPEEIIGKNDFDFLPKDLAKQYYNDEQQVLRSGQPLINREEIIENQTTKKQLWNLVTKAPLRDNEGNIVGLVGIGRDITKRKEAEQQIQQRSEELAVVNQIGQALSRLKPPSEIVELLYNNIGLVLDNRNLYIAIYDETSQSISYPVYTLNGLHSTMQSHAFANGLTEYVIRTKAPLLIPRNQRVFLKEKGLDLIGNSSASFLAVPMQVGERVIGVIAIQDYEREDAYDTNHMELLDTLATQGAIALENARLFEETHRRMEELAAVAEVSSALRVAQTRAEMLPVVLDQLTSLLKADGAAIAMHNPASGETLIELARGNWDKWKNILLPPGEGISGNVIATGRPYINNDVRNDSQMTHLDLLGDLRAVACVPLATKEQTIGAVWIGRKTEILTDEVRLLTAISNIAANAIHRAALHEQTERQVQRLTAMHAIDTAISSSFDLHFTLDILLTKVVSQLNVDAAAILLLDPHTLFLEYFAGRGFRTKQIVQSRLRLGEGYAGRTALERRTWSIKDLRDITEKTSLTPMITAEGFIAYFGVPLIVKGRVQGVLEIFHRTPLRPDSDWLVFLETLGGQAAIAIDNAQLFDDLQRSNINLHLAYDATIKGLSNALDLRDRETEGHTERVTEMTISMARMLNFDETDLVNIRRGALLHDIGKMGVPDGILLKPGKLTSSEWAVMHQHPQLAYDMLSPITYLRPALDIPYCHHEKWDGTGYPRGMKGEQIPIAARLFAVVDVWDALRSNRPYREAWPEEKVLEFIKACSGTHFEPKVVELFLSVVGEKSDSPLQTMK